MADSSQYIVESGAVAIYVNPETQSLESIRFYRSTRDKSLHPYLPRYFTAKINSVEDAEFAAKLRSSDIKTVKLRVGISRLEEYSIDLKQAIIEYMPASSASSNFIFQFLFYLLQLLFRYYPGQNKDLWSTGGLVVEDYEQFYLLGNDDHAFSVRDLTTRTNAIYRAFEPRFYVHPHIFWIYTHLMSIYAFITRNDNLRHNLTIDYSKFIPQGVNTDYLVDAYSDYRRGDKDGCRQNLRLLRDSQQEYLGRAKELGVATPHSDWVEDVKKRPFEAVIANTVLKFAEGQGSTFAAPKQRTSRKDK